MKRVLLALVVVLAGAAAAPTAVAQSDDGVLEDFVDAEDDDTDWSAVAGAALQRVQWQVSQISVFSDEPNETDLARADRGALQATFNSNNQSIQNYANVRFDGNESAWNVIAIHHVRGDANVTQYLVADVQNGSFANARMVNSTDRTVDKTVTLSGFASDNAADELDRFVTKFVEPDVAVSKSYVRQLAAKYGGSVEPPEELTNDTS